MHFAQDVESRWRPRNESDRWPGNLFSQRRRITTINESPKAKNTAQSAGKRETLRAPRPLSVQPGGRQRNAVAFLGTHRGQQPRADGVACRLAGTAYALPSGTGFSARALSRRAVRRHGNAHGRAEQAAVLIFQRRSDLGFSALDRHETFRRIELHAHGARLRKNERLPLPRERHSPREL